MMAITAEEARENAIKRIKELHSGELKDIMARIVKASYLYIQQTTR